MDEKFQDRIDDYLLNRMNVDEKESFLHEIEQDADKKEQFEFTQNVKASICSREEKLRALAQFQQKYEKERKAREMRATGTSEVCYCSAPHIEERNIQSKKKLWLWISGVAAVLVVGFFSVKFLFNNGTSPNGETAPIEKMRGGDDIFSPVPADSTDKDTIKFKVEKEITPDE